MTRSNLWTAPIGDSRLNRLLRRQQQAEQQAKIIAELALETDGPIRITSTRPAGDERTLRGIPAIGRSVTGAIPGSRPGANLA